MSAETFHDETNKRETDINMGQDNDYSSDVEMDEDIDEPVEKHMKAEISPKELSIYMNRALTLSLFACLSPISSRKILENSNFKTNHC